MAMTSVSLVMMIVSTFMVLKVSADEGGSGTVDDRVKCYCTRDITFGTNGCYSNATSNHLCAQSEPGGNIICATYSSNCK